MKNLLLLAALLPSLAFAGLPPVSVNPAASNGLSVVANRLSMQAATDSVPGALTAADHVAFGAKQAALVPGHDLWVDRNGSDTASCSIAAPCQTVGHALTLVTSPSSTNNWTIHLLSGRNDQEVDDLLIPPYTWIVGNGGPDVGSYLRLPSGKAIKISSGWTVNARGGLQSIYLGGGTSVNLDFAGLGGSAGSNFMLDDVFVTGSFTHTGRGINGGDFIYLQNSLIFGAASFTGSELQSNETVYNSTFTAATGTTVASHLSMLGGQVVGAFQFTQGNAQTAALSSSGTTYTGGFTTVGTIALTADLNLPIGYVLSGGTMRTNTSDATGVPYTPGTSGNWPAVPASVSAALDSLAPLASTSYFSDIHVFPQYSGTVSTGSYAQPYKTIQAAINAAASGGHANTVILVHGQSSTENLTINNYTNNLLIAFAPTSVVDSQPFVLNGNITISGTSTRIRFKDFNVAYPGGTQPDLIDSSAGRNYFSNMGFQGGGGVSFTGSWARWHEFTDCTLAGPVSIAGTPSANSSVSLWRVRGGANYTVNATNATLNLYDSFSVGNVTQTAGVLIVDGGRGWVSGSTIASTTNGAGDLFELSNVNLQTGASTFVTVNKSGTSPYLMQNVFHNVSTDTITGTPTFVNYPVIPVQAAASTPACASADKGKLAFTSANILCGCTGSAWKQVSDGSTSCTF